VGIESYQFLRADGRWTFAQTADILRHAAVYVGPETATTHLAAACGTPTVALYGRTDPAIWEPWPAIEEREYARAAMRQRRGNVLLLQNPELSCVPRQLEGCDRHRGSYSQCLDRLAPERVIARCVRRVALDRRTAELASLRGPTYAKARGEARSSAAFAKFLC
jgi:ADP-heptose:LPS heptosyltransferase